jgi:hypothetical protein
MLAGVEPLGLVGVALVPGALRYPLGITEELIAPADYADTTIGIRPSGVAAATFGALGAEAKVVVPGSVAGLDGAELDPITIGTVRYDREARAITGNVVFWPRVMTIVMNGGSFARLSREQQAALRSAGREIVAPQLARVEAEAGQTMAYLCSGFTVVYASTQELAALRAAVDPVYHELEDDETTRDLIAEIGSMRGTVPAGSDDIGGCPEPQGDADAASDPAQLAGRWEAQLTYEELVDVVESDLAEQLAGEWALVFEDGELRALGATTGEEAAVGAFEIDGNVVTIVWDHGIGIQPGGTETLEWSVYRGLLTFAPSATTSPDAQVFTIKPFVRVPDQG